jgi:hypothetical protein
MTVREAWLRVNAKREEHQEPAILQPTAGETLSDFQRAGLQWIEAAAREHDFDAADFIETMEMAQAITTPNLTALVSIGLLGPGDLPDACFGGGFACGLLTGLEIAKDGAR